MTQVSLPTRILQQIAPTLSMPSLPSGWVGISWVPVKNPLNAFVVISNHGDSCMFMHPKIAKLELLSSDIWPKRLITEVKITYSSYKFKLATIIQFMCKNHLQHKINNTTRSSKTSRIPKKNMSPKPGGSQMMRPFGSTNATTPRK